MIELWLTFVNILNILGFPACPLDMAPAGFVCMDLFEAPNLGESNPWVVRTAHEARAWCEAQGKRLCTEDEWDLACLTSSQDGCNNDKRWRPWDRETANTPEGVRELWQGIRSGSAPGCRTPAGVFDLVGNVEEWVDAREGRDWPVTLKGGWWAKKTGCLKSNDAHPPSFKFYQVGFRCCLTVPLWP